VNPTLGYNIDKKFNGSKVSHLRDYEQETVQLISTQHNSLTSKARVKQPKIHYNQVFFSIFLGSL
jgi:hypothetical protein